MSFITENNELKAKLAQFAEELNNLPLISSLHLTMDKFLADKKNSDLYERMEDCQENIVLKQNAGVELTEEDLDEYKDIHLLLNSSPQAEDFFSAQETLLNLQEEINGYMSLAVQLGTSPSDEELEAILNPTSELDFDDDDHNHDHGCGCGSC